MRPDAARTANVQVTVTCEEVKSGEDARMMRKVENG